MHGVVHRRGGGHGLPRARPPRPVGCAARGARPGDFSRPPPFRPVPFHGHPVRSLACRFVPRPRAHRARTPRPAWPPLVLEWSLARRTHQGPRGHCLAARDRQHLMAALRPEAPAACPPPASWSGDRFARPCPLAPPPRRARPCFHALLLGERALPPFLHPTRAGRLHAAFDRRLLARDRPLAPPVVALPPRRDRFTRSQEGSRPPARLVGVGAGVLHHERVAA